MAFFARNGAGEAPSGSPPKAGQDEAPDLLPEDIDGRFAPRPRESVVSRSFDDELLIVNGVTGRIHLLNSVAAVVWGCFDGTVALDELVDELSDAYRTAPETIMADVLGMVRQLGSLELLEGVSPSVRTAPSRPGVRDIGDQILIHNVLTSDGERVTIPREGSTGTVLVNWSPSCGYCVKIADDLGRYRPGLLERGIDLVLLTVKSAEENIRVLGPVGLGDAAFYRDQTEGSETSGDPFTSFGTPVAYLLDGDGRVERPIAWGAAEVPTLVRDASGESREATGSPVGPEAAGGEQHSRPRRRSLPAAGGMCGPATTGDGKAPQEWAGTSRYLVGDYEVGIRADSDRTDKLLAQAFPSYRSDDDSTVPIHFSVVLGSEDTDGAGDVRTLSLLLAGDTTVVRSRSPRRVIEALRAHLSSLLDADDAGLVRTTSVGALAGGRAMLLPPAVHRWMGYLQPRLARLGVRLSDEPYGLVDPVTLELVVPEPQIQIAPEGLAELSDTPASRSELPPLEPGRYRLGAWAVATDPSGTPTGLSTAGTVAALLPVVDGSPDQLAELIEVLGDLAERTTVVPVRCSSDRELMQDIESRLLAGDEFSL